MKKFGKFFIIGLVTAIVAFSSAMAIPTGIAQGAQSGPPLADNSVTSAKIRDGEVKTPDIANGAVTKEKLAQDSVSVPKLVVIPREGPFTPVPAHQIGTAKASCESGEVLISGSYSPGSFNLFPPTVIQERIFPANEYRVSAVNNGDPTAPDSSIRAIANCAHFE